MANKKTSSAVALEATPAKFKDDPEATYFFDEVAPRKRRKAARAKAMDFPEIPEVGNLSLDEGTYKLTGPITVPAGKTIVIPADTDVTIDFNGQTMTQDSASLVCLFAVAGTLKFKDSTSAKAGKILRSTVSATCNAIVQLGSYGKVDGIEQPITDGATLELNDIAIEITGTSESAKEHWAYGVNLFGKNTKFVMNSGRISAIGPDANIVSGNGTPSRTGEGCVIEINGGVIEGKAYDGGPCAIYHPHAGTLIVNGGKIKDNYIGIAQHCGTMFIHGGEIEFTDSTLPIPPPQWHYTDGTAGVPVGAVVSVGRGYPGGDHIPHANLWGGAVTSNRKDAEGKTYPAVQFGHMKDKTPGQISVSDGCKITPEISEEKKQEADPGVYTEDTVFPEELKHDVAKFQVNGDTKLNGVNVEFGPVVEKIGKYFEKTNAEVVPLRVK